jgi:predicted CopG family antitoxin
MRKNITIHDKVYKDLKKLKKDLSKIRGYKVTWTGVIEYLIQKAELKRLIG